MNIKISKSKNNKFNFFNLLISNLFIRKDITIIKKCNLEEDLNQFYDKEKSQSRNSSKREKLIQLKNILIKYKRIK